MILITLSFFVTAILYAAVGFGGGSTYSALLVLAKTDSSILPSISLVCNLLVVTGGTYRFARAGHVDIRRLTPWVITSVPAALLGGYLNISEVFFVGTLGFSLLVAGINMLLLKNEKQYSKQPWIDKHCFLPPLIGTALGLLSGFVGIGGGIFLAPILYLLHWGSAKKIAAACSVFILVNSISGLLGHAIKLGDTEFLNSISVYWVLFLAVLIGGQLGSYTGAKYLNPNALRFLTVLLILYVSVRLILRWWVLAS